MACTSSSIYTNFNNNKTIQIDGICFSGMNCSFKNKDNIIIIEKSKQFYPISIINEWLDDLKEIGLPIDSYSINEDEEYRIKMEPSTKFNYIITGMLVRCLWEGIYKQQHQDNFFHVINSYFELKKYDLPYNKLERICLSINYYYIMFDGYNNAHHILSNSSGCKIFKELPVDTHVNNTFSITNDCDILIKDLFKKPKRWTKKKFKELYELVV